MEPETRSLLKIDLLLVEDDESHVQLILRAFRPSEEYVEIRHARDLQDMQSELQRKLPDFLILDYLLPDGRSVDALAMAGLPDELPVVVLTSFRDSAVDREVADLGALAVIQKSDAGFRELPQLVLSHFQGTTPSPGMH